MSAQHSISGLYALTHHDQLSEAKMLEDMEAVIKGGAKLIQFRDKFSKPDEKKHRAQNLLALCKNYQIPLIINDDLNLCIAIDADGVHLGQEDGSVSEARRRLGENKIIGVTCHNSPALALEAKQHHASYIALGSFFPSHTKTNAKPAELACIQQVKAMCELPLVAIGGITLDNAPVLLKHKVDALAVIHDLLDAENIELRAAQFTHLFTRFRH